VMEELFKSGEESAVMFVGGSKADSEKLDGCNSGFTST
jgi:hypothetical protein